MLEYNHKQDDTQQTRRYTTKKTTVRTETVNYRNRKNHLQKEGKTIRKQRIRKEFNTMSRYAGTKTEKNLEAAFSGESQARKQIYYASVAKKEGYEQIAALFLKTADNEKEHAKMWFKELDGISDTAANLAAAAAG